MPKFHPRTFGGTTLTPADVANQLATFGSKYFAGSGFPADMRVIVLTYLPLMPPIWRISTVKIRMYN
ncbi:MAG: hypothetical protein U0930_15260 [Pirellulales bacterium]